ncbi:MAG: hypothetical protein JRH15_07000 [Deltaproteobacteria bacterium]|nr:hypothetical protein [Deltaproteobacteria bacterium]
MKLTEDKSSVIDTGVLRRTGELILMALLLCGLTGVSAMGQAEFSVKSPRATRSLLLDAQNVGGTLVVVGERGHILVSSDGGDTWRQAEVPTRGMLTGVYFHDNNLGWAVGYYQEILRSRDGGESWQRVYANREDGRPLLDVWFRDEDNGIAVGAYGLFLVTGDGGDTWTSKSLNVTQSFAEEEGISSDEMAFLGAFGADEDELGDDMDAEAGVEVCLNHIARSATGRLYIAAEVGTIYRSEDDGQSWTALASPYNGSFFNILPLDGDSLLLLGLRGHLFRSEDGGDTWQEIETGTAASLLGGVRLAGGSIVVTGLEGTMLISRDGGRSFTYRQHPSRKDIVTAVTPDGKHVMLVGEFGVKRAKNIASRQD